MWNIIWNVGGTLGHVVDLHYVKDHNLKFANEIHLQKLHEPFKLIALDSDQSNCKNVDDLLLVDKCNWKFFNEVQLKN